MSFTFIILHYHLRPCGVRRVIELATPSIIKKIGGCKIVLASGEEPPDDWFNSFKSSLQNSGENVELFIRPSFCYTSESSLKPGELKKRISKDIESLLSGLTKDNSIIWFHNPAIGRNIILTDELFKAARKRQITVMAHHHDWWFENRWQRYKEIQDLTFSNLDTIARAIFPSSNNIKHCAINYLDFATLKKFLDSNAGWLPNPIQLQPAPVQDDISKTKKWLANQLGDTAPIWLMPSRVLRRKNIAEALLLKQWLRPDAWLITTAKESSSNELDYAVRLIQAANKYGWKLRLGVLSDNCGKSPNIPAMYSASEAVLMTSIQEGFGLTYIETAIFNRPLIARILPNLEKDFKLFGLRFPQSYYDIIVPPTLFDWDSEARRQKLLYENWLSAIPNKYKDEVKIPQIVKDPSRKKPVPFSKLTLTGQLEVLTCPPEYSFKQCVKLNPFLNTLKKRVLADSLKPTELTEKSLKLLSVDAYAENFWRIVSANKQQTRNVSAELQDYFIKQKLSEKFVYPLLIESKEN